MRSKPSRPTYRRSRRPSRRSSRRPQSQAMDYNTIAVKLQAYQSQAAQVGPFPVQQPLQAALPATAHSCTASTLPGQPDHHNWGCWHPRCSDVLG